MTTIRIATRSSAQARTQAEAVGALLTAARDGVAVGCAAEDMEVAGENAG